MTEREAETAAPAQQDPLLGTLLGHFKIERIIAVGGMGVIYRATHDVIGRTAAIKVLSQKYSSDRSMIKRLHREARAVNQIGHPNIIDIFDFGQTPDGREYFVMEFLPGKSLAELMEQHGQLPWSLTAPVMTQLLDALGAAHDEDIVHRDIKPENILVMQQDDKVVAKILDFGIAKSVGLGPEGERLTRAGVVLGTPEYIAPEQIRGKEIDRRADLYSMGVILFEMVMGHRPFQGDTVINLLMSHLKDPIPPIEGLPPELGIPGFVPAVINRALSKDREQRFPDAATFARALQLETSAVAPTDGTRPLPQMMWEREQARDAAAPPPGGVLDAPTRTLPGAPSSVEDAVPTGPDLPPRQATPPGTLPGAAMAGEGLDRAPRRKGFPIALVAILALLVLGGGGAGLYFGLLRGSDGPDGTTATRGAAPDARREGPAAPRDVDLQALYEKVRRVLRTGSNNTKVGVRRTCISGMGKLRDAEASALIASVLANDPDRVVRSAAAMAIADLGDPAGAEALREARTRSSDVMKVWIDEALMRLGKPEGRIGLRSALRSRKRDVRFQAALALGEAGSSAALPVLKEMARNAATLDRSTSIAILGTLAQLGHEPSLTSLKTAVAGDDKVIKLGAAEALAKLGHQQAMTTLKELLGSSDLTSRLVAAKVLASMGDFSGLEPLSEGVRAKDASIRQLAANGLGAVSDRAAIPPLAVALEDSSWPVKAVAAESLARIFALMPTALIRQSQDWVKTALANRDWSVRHAAVGITSEMDPELAVALLGWAFKDADPRVRAAAVESLGQLKSRQALPLLRRALADPDEKVRTRAARALGTMADKGSSEALHATVRDESPTVGIAAAGALLAMGDTAYVKDLDRAAASRNPRLRRAAVMALGKWDDPGATRRLKRALKDRSPQVRFSAAYQLSRRGDASGAAELRRVAREGSGRDQRLALEAMLALGIKPTKEVVALSRSRGVENRTRAMRSAELIAPQQALEVLRRGARAPEPKVRLAAAAALTRLAKQERGTLPLLQSLARDPDPAVRAQARVGLAKARRAHTDLTRLDRGEVKPVEPAPLSPAPEVKPKAKPRAASKEPERPLFVDPESPQQRFMRNLSFASGAVASHRYGAALRHLRRARRLGNSPAIPCEFGFTYHMMGLNELRRGKRRAARKSLASAKRYHRQCVGSNAAPKLKQRARKGLKDIRVTLRMLK